MSILSDRLMQQGQQQFAAQWLWEHKAVLFTLENISDTGLACMYLISHYWPHQAGITPIAMDVNDQEVLSTLENLAEELGVTPEVQEGEEQAVQGIGGALIAQLAAAILQKLVEQLFKKS